MGRMVDIKNSALSHPRFGLVLLSLLDLGLLIWLGCLLAEAATEIWSMFAAFNLKNFSHVVFSVTILCGIVSAVVEMFLIKTVFIKGDWG